MDAKDLRDLIKKIRLSAASARAQEERINTLKLEQQRAALQQEETERQTGSQTLSLAARGTLGQTSVPFSKAKGKIQFPAAGPIVRQFGEDDGHGITSKGLRINVRNGAQIVAPYGGEIAYAGKFRGYGLLLIIAHGEGYHSLISGLSSVYVVVGQLVLANEPIGEVKRSGRANSTLYVELRRKGEAFNPLPWMAARNSKVNG